MAAVLTALARHLARGNAPPFTFTPCFTLDAAWRAPRADVAAMAFLAAAASVANTRVLIRAVEALPLTRAEVARLQRRLAALTAAAGPLDRATHAQAVVRSLPGRQGALRAVLASRVSPPKLARLAKTDWRSTARRGVRANGHRPYHGVPGVFGELAKHFEREAARFAKAFPAWPRPAFRIEHAPCVLPDACALRDFAYCVRRGRRATIVAHFRLAYAAPRRIAGVLRHELGHAYDVRIDDPGAEQRADDLAERVTGEKICYDRGDVQVVGRGAYPRPRHLPA